MVIIFCNTCYADIARVIAPVNSIQRDGLSVKALLPASRQKGIEFDPFEKRIIFYRFLRCRCQRNHVAIFIPHAIACNTKNLRFLQEKSAILHKIICDST